MAPRILQRAVDQLACRRDPIGFARRRGVQVGDRVELLGTTPHTFGSEPYLITLGDGVTISHDVTFVTHDGGLRVVRDEHPDAYFYAPIVIEPGAFIGAGVMLLPGVTVGARSVVGARSLVTADIPAGVVAAGVPARPIRSVEEYALARQDRWIDTAGLDAHAKERRLRAEFRR